jgi:hypothetical protein
LGVRDPFENLGLVLGARRLRRFWDWGLDLEFLDSFLITRILVEGFCQRQAQLSPLSVPAAVTGILVPFRLIPGVFKLLDIKRLKFAGRVLGFVLLPHGLEIAAEVRFGLPSALVELKACPFYEVVGIAIRESMLGEDTLDAKLLVGIMPRHSRCHRDVVVALVSVRREGPKRGPGVDLEHGELTSWVVRSTFNSWV